jgi:hypothetical protein
MGVMVGEGIGVTVDVGVKVFVDVGLNEGIFVSECVGWMEVGTGVEGLHPDRMRAKITMSIEYLNMSFLSLQKSILWNYIQIA